MTRTAKRGAPTVTRAAKVTGRKKSKLLGLTQQVAAAG